MGIVAAHTLVLLGAVVVAGCGDSTSPVMDPALEAALNELTDAQESLAIVIFNMGGHYVPSAGKLGICPYNSGDKRFVCPDTTVSGITLSRSYQLLDATGAAQSVWGTNVVAIRSVTDAAGTFPDPSPWSSTHMTRRDEYTLSGLGSDTRTLTGTGTSTVNVSDAVGSGASITNMTRTTNLTLPPETGPNTYPTGTITAAMTVQRVQLTSSTKTVTFDGTPTATMVTVNGSLTQTCTMNLASPTSALVCTTATTVY
jgi:hypothetical protein